jgi:hypothetical protein
MGKYLSIVGGVALVGWVCDFSFDVAQLALMTAMFCALGSDLADLNTRRATMNMFKVRTVLEEDTQIFFVREDRPNDRQLFEEETAKRLRDFGYTVEVQDSFHPNEPVGKTIWAPADLCCHLVDEAED